MLLAVLQGLTKKAADSLGLDKVRPKAPAGLSFPKLRPVVNRASLTSSMRVAQAMSARGNFSGVAPATVKVAASLSADATRRRSSEALFRALERQRQGDLAHVQRQPIVARSPAGSRWLASNQLQSGVFPGSERKLVEQGLRRSRVHQAVGGGLRRFGQKSLQAGKQVGRYTAGAGLLTAAMGGWGLYHTLRAPLGAAGAALARPVRPGVFGAGVRNLSQDLGGAGWQPRFAHTVRGIGGVSGGTRRVSPLV